MVSTRQILNSPENLPPPEKPLHVPRPRAHRPASCPRAVNISHNYLGTIFLPKAGAPKARRPAGNNGGVSAHAVIRPRDHTGKGRARVRPRGIPNLPLLPKRRGCSRRPAPPFRKAPVGRSDGAVALANTLGGASRAACVSSLRPGGAHGPRVRPEAPHSRASPRAPAFRASAFLLAPIAGEQSESATSAVGDLAAASGSPALKCD